MGTPGRPGYRRTAGSSPLDSLIAVLLRSSVPTFRRKRKNVNSRHLANRDRLDGSNHSTCTGMLVDSDTNVISTFQTDEIRALFVEMAKHNSALISLHGGKL